MRKNIYSLLIKAILSAKISEKKRWDRKDNTVHKLINIQILNVSSMMKKSSD